MMRPEMTPPQALQPQRAFIDVTAVGDTPLIPGVPGTHIRLSKVVLTAGGAAVITLKEGTRDDSGTLRVATHGHIVLMFESDLPLAFPAGQPLVLHLSAAIRVTGFVEYTQVKQREGFMPSVRRWVDRLDLREGSGDKSPQADRG
jgi:hypothetical protein